MKILIVFFLLMPVLIAQPTPADNYTCDPAREETLNSLAVSELSDLRMQMFVLSQFQTQTPNDAIHMQIVAQEAVFAFANDVSRHADQLQRCALPMMEYYASAGELNRFGISLNETTGLNLFVTALKMWPFSDTEPLVGHMAFNPEVRGKELPLHPIITNVLIGFARRWDGPADTTDPVQVAARELLGEKVAWSVAGFKPIKRLQRNQNNVLHHKDFLYTEELEKFRAKPASERLAILAEYYLPFQ